MDWTSDSAESLLFHRLKGKCLESTGEWSQKADFQKLLWLALQIAEPQKPIETLVSPTPTVQHEFMQNSDTPFKERPHGGHRKNHDLAGDHAQLCEILSHQTNIIYPAGVLGEPFHTARLAHWTWLNKSPSLLQPLMQSLRDLLLRRGVSLLHTP